MNFSALKLTPVDRQEEDDGLKIKVPEFPMGDSPAREFWRPLLEKVDDPADLPIYCAGDLIRRVVKNERSYRRRHPRDWRERCWFLGGNVRRSTDGKLWGSLDRVLPARHLTATAGSFEFSAFTWSSFFQEIEARGQIGMGWLHTHSLKFLAEMPEELEKEQTLTGCEAAMIDPAERIARIKSGLFLSSTDILSAWKRGFAMPQHISCVLDSDACLNVKGGRELALEEALGVWGWSGLRLRRRSINIVRG